MNFNDSGVAVIGLNNTTGKLEDKAFLFAPKEEITSANFTGSFALFLGIR